MKRTAARVAHPVTGQPQGAAALAAAVAGAQNPATQGARDDSQDAWTGKLALLVAAVLRRVALFARRITSGEARLLTLETKLATMEKDRATHKAATDATKVALDKKIQGDQAQGSAAAAALAELEKALAETEADFGITAP